MMLQHLIHLFTHYSALLIASMLSDTTVCLPSREEQARARAMATVITIYVNMYLYPSLGAFMSINNTSKSNSNLKMGNIIEMV